MCEFPKCDDPAQLSSLIDRFGKAQPAPIPEALMCLEPVLKPELELQAILIARALKQAERDGLDHDEAVLDPTSRFYQDILGYVLYHCVFKMCTSCHLPFFAGVMIVAI